MAIIPFLLQWVLPTIGKRLLVIRPNALSAATEAETDATLPSVADLARLETPAHTCRAEVKQRLRRIVPAPTSQITLDSPAGWALPRIPSVACEHGGLPAPALPRPDEKSGTVRRGLSILPPSKTTPKRYGRKPNHTKLINDSAHSDNAPADALPSTNSSETPMKWIPQTMNAAMRFTQRDRSIFEILTGKLRAADDELLFSAFTTSQHGSRLADRLRRWHEAGLIGRTQAVVRKINIVEPVVTWRPGQPSLNFDAISWRLQSRWNVAPRPIRVSWATAQAAEFFGGVGGRLSQPLQLEHDLGTSAAYFSRLRSHPDDADAWVGEDVYRREHRPSRRSKVPDAVLLDSSGHVQLAIEFGGAYAAQRVRSFHRYCARQNLPYEIW